MKPLLLIISLLCLLASPALAVTRDTETQGQKGEGGTTLTVSHTVTTSGGNRALLLFCGMRNDTVTITATYAGAAMTEVRRDQASLEATWVFQKINPATGTNDWVATTSGINSMICHAVSVTDANQSTLLTDHDGVCNASGTSSTRTLTTAANELLLDVMEVRLETITLAQGANQTDEIDPPLESTGTTMTVGGSRQDGADGGVMSWSWTGAQTSCQSAVSIAHSAFVASGSGAIRRRMQ